jgi:hypothetical protein
MNGIAYLYDSSGNWIAFRKGTNIFSPAGSWLGWLPGTDSRVLDTDGNYLATIFGEDRLFRELYPNIEPDAIHPGYPGREESPNHPGYPGRKEAPVGMEDVSLLEHA